MASPMVLHEMQRVIFDLNHLLVPTRWVLQKEHMQTIDRRDIELWFQKRTHDGQATGKLYFWYIKSDEARTLELTLKRWGATKATVSSNSSWRPINHIVSSESSKVTPQPLNLQKPVKRKTIHSWPHLLVGLPSRNWHQFIGRKCVLLVTIQGMNIRITHFCFPWSPQRG